jgi:hypothetical protein
VGTRSVTGMFLDMCEGIENKTIVMWNRRIRSRETDLARESGPSVGLIDEKNEGQLSHDTVPLNM